MVRKYYCMDLGVDVHLGHGGTMKIQVTEHELLVILEALKSQQTVITMHLAAKLNAQDTAEDGPEVAILSVEA